MGGFARGKLVFRGGVCLWCSKGETAEKLITTLEEALREGLRRHMGWGGAVEYCD